MAQKEMCKFSESKDPETWLRETLILSGAKDEDIGNDRVLHPEAVHALVTMAVMHFGKFIVAPLIGVTVGDMVGLIKTALK